MQGRWSISVRGEVRRYSLGTIVAGRHIRAPIKLEIQTAGALLVADSGTGQILQLNPRTGVALSIVPQFTRLEALARGPDGTIFVLADEKLWRLDVAGRRLVASFADEGPTDLAPRSDGSVYVSRYGAHIDLVAPDGTISVVARGFDRPHGITLAADGGVLVADSYADAVRRIAPDGRVTTLAVGLARPTDVVLDRDGTLLVAEHDAGRISRIGRDGTVTSVATGLRGPSGVALAADGSRYVADIDGGAVVAIRPNGQIKRVSR